MHCSNEARSYRLSELRVASRVGNTLRAIYLPDGGKCETPHNDAVDAILSRRGESRFHGWLHRLESRARYAILFLALSVALVWGGIQFGIPVLAEKAAFALPAGMEQELGTHTLDALDRLAFASSGLSVFEQDRLRQMFAEVAGDLDAEDGYRLEFRSSEKLGANAFALPSGIIVITDDLVRLAVHEQELVAVFAHELGHVVNRHALRSVLQDSAAALLVATLVGDVVSVTSLAAALPTLLLQARYSRAFEIEADRFALDYLHAKGISIQRFADILGRLEDEHEGDDLGYLSSHPATDERIQALTLGE